MQQAPTASAMHFRADAKKLAAVLESIERATEHKTTIPILGCVLLTAEGGAVTVRATDLVVEMTCRVPEAEVVADGAVSLRVIPLLAIVRSIDGPVEISAAPGLPPLRTNLRAKGLRSTLAGLDPAAFPAPIPVPPGGAVVKQAFLQTLINRCDFAASQREDNRFSLSCLKFTMGNGVIDTVGTDGHRLSHAIMPLQESPASPMSFLVTLRAIPIAHSLGEGEDLVHISEGNDSIAFTCGPTVLAVRRITGQFPDWRKIFPASSSYSATLASGPLQATLGRINAVADDKHLFLALFTQTEIRLRAASAMVGEIFEDFECRCEGRPVLAAYNSQYLLEFLTRSAGDVTLALSDDKGPLVVMCEGWRHIIMPMSVKKEMVPREWAEIMAEGVPARTGEAKEGALQSASQPGESLSPTLEVEKDAAVAAEEEPF